MAEINYCVKLRVFLTAANPGPTLKLKFKNVGKDKLTLYDAIDQGNEFAVALELEATRNSPFANSLRHHARIYALADATWLPLSRVALEMAWAHETIGRGLQVISITGIGSASLTGWKCVNGSYRCGGGTP
ncbi:hypothetical protein A2U01_0012918 [Trifolium medium]|uniref:Uncharacterized protein n=1 Tax=Trifolium medium TaxID=97028 RepID=A0A392MWR5_9FABA|nr:hypothetical protein [Trifolium medium]